MRKWDNIGSGRIRTCVLNFAKSALCPLSYAPGFRRAFGSFNSWRSSGGGSLRFYILAAVLFLIVPRAFAQGVLINLPPITNSQGQPLAGVTVSVFQASGPANALVCGAPVTVYSNAALSTPISPLVTDGFGNFPFYIATSGTPYGYTVGGQNTNSTTCYGFMAQLAAGSSPAFSSLVVTGAATTQSINGDLWVGSGSGQYASMAACYAALSTGQVCHVTAGWSETFSSSLTISKNNTGFIFHGLATITMGTNQIIVPVSTNGFLLAGAIPFGAYFLAGGVTPTPGLKFVYTGTTTPLLIGANSADTQHIWLENITFDLGGAGSSAIGMQFVRTQLFTVANVHVDFTQAPNTQIGWLMDGTGNFTGNSDIRGFYSLFAQTGIKCIGAGTAGCNNNNLTGGGVFVSGIPGSKGFDIQCGNGNQWHGLDIESAVTTINLGNSGCVTGNEFSVYNGLETTFVNAGAASHDNSVVAMTSDPSAKISDSGTRNIVWYDGTMVHGSLIPAGLAAAPTNQVTLLNQQGALAPITGTGADATVYTFSIPANVLAAGKGVRIRVWANHTTGTGSIRWKTFVGSTAYTDDTATSNSGANGRGYWEVNVFNNAGVQNAQSGASITAVPNNTTTTATFTNFSTVTSAENTVNAVTVKFTFNAANTEQVTGGLWIVELIQ